MDILINWKCDKVHYADIDTFFYNTKKYFQWIVILN